MFGPKLWTFNEHQNRKFNLYRFQSFLSDDKFRNFLSAVAVAVSCICCICWFRVNCADSAWTPVACQRRMKRRQPATRIKWHWSIFGWSRWTKTKIKKKLSMQRCSMMYPKHSQFAALIGTSTLGLVQDYWPNRSLQPNLYPCRCTWWRTLVWDLCSVPTLRVFIAQLAISHFGTDQALGHLPAAGSW